jgi:hypothetical protein
VERVLQPRRAGDHVQVGGVLQAAEQVPAEGILAVLTGQVGTEVFAPKTSRSAFQARGGALGATTMLSRQSSYTVWRRSSGAFSCFQLVTRVRLSKLGWTRRDHYHFVPSPFRCIIGLVRRPSTLPQYKLLHEVPFIGSRT